MTDGTKPARYKALAVTLAVAAIAALALTVAWQIRERRHAQEPPRARVDVNVEELLKLGDKARGPGRQMAYHERELAVATTPAVGRRGAATEWTPLPEGTVIVVTDATVEGEEIWVRGIVRSAQGDQPVLVHASFLEHYLPVVLDNVLELSDVRFLRQRTGRAQSLTGYLRNITSQSISQCVVVCVFRDAQQREVAVTRSDAMTLVPYELVRFNGGRIDKPFASVALQTIYGSAEGLRNYLSSVVIEHNAGN